MSTKSVSRLNIDDLVKSFDAIPTMMSELKREDRSQEIHEARQNAHRPFVKVRTNPFSGVSQADRIAEQANRVISHLSSLNPSSRETVDLSQVAHRARECLTEYQRANGGTLKKVFGPFDSSNSGIVTRKDFLDSLRMAGAGLKGAEAKALVQSLDRNNVGCIKYSSVVSELARLERECAQQQVKRLDSQPVSSYNNTMSSDLLRLAAEPAPRSYTAATNLPSSTSNVVDEGANAVISIFDLAQSNPKYPSSFSPVKVSPMLAGGDISCMVLTHGRRYGYSRNTSVTPFGLDDPKKLCRRSRSRDASTPSDRRSRSAPPTLRSGGSGKNSLMEALVHDAQSPDSPLKSTPSLDVPSRSSLRHQLSVPKKSVSSTFSSSSSSSVTTATTAESRRSESEASVGDADIAENAIVSQFVGSIGGLKHRLSKNDLSRSGKLNYEEFRLALKGAGLAIADGHVLPLFRRHAAPTMHQHGHYGYTEGGSVDIDKFVSSLGSKASAPMFQHLSGSKAQASKDIEERRIMKKVVHATNKLSDPMLVFQQLEPRQKSYISAEQLKKGLNSVGASLDDREFQVLMNKVDLNHDGRIDIQEFQTMLHSDLHQQDRSAIMSRQADLKAHSRYSDTFKSNELLHSHAQPEFAHIRDSKCVRDESYRWSKLKGYLQSKSDDLLAAFSVPGSTAEPGLLVESITTDQLKHRLSKRGVYLNPDDEVRLEVQVRRATSCPDDTDAAPDSQSPATNRGSKSSTTAPVVSITTFCDLLGMPVKTTKDERIEICDPRTVVEDGGTFAGSRNSLLSHPTFGTSYYISGEEMLPTAKGNTRRKIPQTTYPHHYEAHKFWNLEQTIGEPDLRISPAPSWREPTIPQPSIEERFPLAGLNRLVFRASAGSDRRGSGGGGVLESSRSSIASSSNYSHANSEGPRYHRGLRAQSAPPRSGGMAAVFSSERPSSSRVVDQAGSQGSAGGASRRSSGSSMLRDTPAANIGLSSEGLGERVGRSRSRGPAGVSSNVSVGSSGSGSYSRWAKKSLSDFIEDKSAGGGAGDDLGSRGGGRGGGGGGDFPTQKISTLRRIVPNNRNTSQPPNQAPFALNY